MQLDRGARTEPNVRATTQELYRRPRRVEPEPLAVAARSTSVRSTTSRRGSFPRASITRRSCGRRHRKWWLRYEHVIRRAAGMGRAASLPDPDSYEHQYAHCDVLVIGAGPAGLAAARSAAHAGARVLLCDENPTLGGGLVGAAATIDGVGGTAWAAAARHRARSAGGRHAPAPDDGVRLLRRHSRRVDRACRRSPSRAASTGRRGSACGKCAPEQWCSPPARTSAASPTRTTICRERCSRVPCARTSSAMRSGQDRAPSCSRTTTARTRRRLRCPAPASTSRRSSIRVRGPRSRAHCRSLRAMPDCPSSPRPRSSAHTARCVSPPSTSCRSSAATSSASIAISSRCPADGTPPSISIRRRAAGCATTTRSRPSSPTARRCPSSPAGAANGQFDLAAALAEGHAAGLAAARRAGSTPARTARRAASRSRRERSADAVVERSARSRNRRSASSTGRTTSRSTTSRWRRAKATGRSSISSATRRSAWAPTRARCPTSSGSRCWRKQLGRPIAEVGTTTFRPPYTPVSLGAFPGIDAGAHVEPTRYSAIHDWHVAHGARFVNAGLWKRPHSYPRAGESADDAAEREARNVRANVGIVDVSTLGKIELQGRDVAEFLNRVYINRWDTLAVGRCRYGVMLRDDGIVLDDGTTSRLAAIALPDDDDDGECGQGPAAPRNAAADRVARARSVRRRR